MKKTELIENIKRKKSFLCVGLDPDVKKLPACLETSEDPLFEFNRAIIDATAPCAVAFKPNLAFYESIGAKGIVSLEKTVRYLREKHPDQFLIADAKRGDIGNTSKMYARTFFEQMEFDAVTVAPYMGRDSVGPFLECPGKWVILLALTSNEGSRDFQMTEDSQGKRLFEKVIETSSQWAGPEQMMYVVGATRGELLGEVRRRLPESFLLVPGVGAQGGSLEEVARYGMTCECGLLVNSSRGIIYASSGEDFAAAAAAEAEKLAAKMSVLLQKGGII